MTTKPKTTTREKHGISFLPVVYAYLKGKADKMGVSVSELINRRFMAEMGMPYTKQDKQEEEKT